MNINTQTERDTSSFSAILAYRFTMGPPRFDRLNQAKSDANQHRPAVGAHILVRRCRARIKTRIRPLVSIRPKTFGIRPILNQEAPERLLMLLSSESQAQVCPPSPLLLQHQVHLQQMLNVRIQCSSLLSIHLFPKPSLENAKRVFPTPLCVSNRFIPSEICAISVYS